MYCITTEMIEAAGRGEFSDDPTLKCYLKCLFDQFRLLSKKGFNFEAMIKLTPPNMKDNVLKMADACRDTSMLSYLYNN